jgi:phosphatidylglycerophosphatase A
MPALEESNVRWLRQPVMLLALGFGTGLFPRAPGTAGSLFALLPAWAMFALPLPWRIGIAIGVCAAGVWICDISARRLGAHDHPAIVFDEIAAMLLLVLTIPGPAWLLPAFLTFRIFDIAKPWPIRDVDHRIAGGLGIMLDDVLAAVYAAAVLQLVVLLLPTV